MKLSTVSRGFRAFFSFLNVFNVLRVGNRRSQHDARTESPPTPADAAKNLEGKVIGPYELINEIDRGTFGAVYCCKHVNTKQSYAAKFYSLDWIHTEEGREILDNELHVMKLLNHRNAVFFQDAIYTRHGILIVMELVRGKTMLDLVPTGGGLMEPFARQIFSQILDGLEYLHQNHIVHRDIKLENVMINYEGDVKIIDYGLAERIPRNSMSGNLLINGECGSMNYYAPEIISSNGRYFRGDLTDIWASGVLLFTIVAGRFPFHQEAEDNNARTDILNCESWVKCWFQSERTLSPELQDLISKIFVKDPNTRPSIADIKQHPWTKGTKLSNTNDQLNTFTSSSGNVTVSFEDREVERCHSCNFNPASRAKSPSRKRIPGRKTYKIQRSSSSPDIIFREARDEDAEKRPKRSEDTRVSEPSQSPRRKFRKALRDLCATPKRILVKIHLRKKARKNDMEHGSQSIGHEARGSPRTAEERRLTIVEHGNRISGRERQRKNTRRGARGERTRHPRPIATA